MHRNIRHPPCRTRLPRNLCRAYVIQLILLLLLYPDTTAYRALSQPATGGITQHNETPAADASRELAPGRPLVREISPGETQTFEINLDVRRYLLLSLRKGDLKIALSVYGPRGQKLFEYLTQQYGPLEASLVADVAGVHRLEVRSLERDGTGSRGYQLRVEQLREARAQDLKDNAAKKEFAESIKLRAVWEEASLRKAIHAFTEVRSAGATVSSPRLAIDALSNIADIHSILGEYRQALRSYSRALAESKRMGDREREFASLNNLGRVYSYLGENDKAQEYSERVIAYYDRPAHLREAREKRAFAEALDNMGVVWYAKGNPIKALKYFRRSLALWLEVADRGGEAQARLNLGYASSNYGEQEEAVAQFRQALALYRAVDDRRGEALTLTAMGVVHSLRGEEQSALDSHLQAIRLARVIGDRQSEAVALNGLGQAYEDLNERQIALDNYKLALKRFRENDSLDFAASTEFQIARLYLQLDDKEQALTHYRRSVLLSREAKKERMEAYALNDIATLYYAAGRKRETLAQYEKILRLYRHIGDRRGQALTLNSIGDLFFSSGEKQKALSVYKQALGLIRAAGDQEAELSTLYNIARTALDRGFLDDALLNIEQSVQIIEALRTYVASPDLRSSYFASVHKHYSLYIDTLMQLDKQRPGRGFAVMALRASESARARSLLEILTEAGTDIRQGAATALLDQERALQRQLQVKARQQTLLQNSEDARSEATEVGRELRQLTAEYQLVQAQLREQSPRYAALTQPTPLSLEEIQSELRDGNTLLLEYALGEEKSYLWAVTPDSLTSYELPPRARLEEAAREVYKLLTARQPAPAQSGTGYAERIEAADRLYDEKARELSRMLLGPVARQLANKRLLIITEGVLQYIPFDALPVPSTETSGESVRDASAPDSGEMRLLVSQHEIVSLPSISTLAAIRRAGRRSNATRNLVAVLADPVFSVHDARVRNETEPAIVSAPQGANAGLSERAFRDLEEFAGGAEIMRLMYTSQEADAILAAAPRGTGFVAKGFDASRETAMGSQLGKYQIVHFATHGLINSEHPELSGIALSMVNKNGAQENGFLQLHDIYNLNLSANLVVLSACNTGLGREVKGEGLIGLTRGFMYAGSKSVVASLWKVDDKATAELMSHFYQGMLQGGLTPAAALRSAKEMMRRQDRWHAPYYWAAFVLQGEYSEQVIRGGNSWPTIGALAAMTLILISVSLLIFIRRRRRLRLR